MNPIDTIRQALDEITKTGNPEYVKWLALAKALEFMCLQDGMDLDQKMTD
jgi:hypothetical protein